jgi:biopolymer transport protein ExbB/TolQ
MLTDKLMRLTIAGGSEWVMVLLLGLSVISVAIIVERALFFRRQRQRLSRLDELLSPLIEGQNTRKMTEVLSRESTPSLRAAVSGYQGQARDREATEKIVASSLGRERLALERRLTFLGTLGNNAPFIGLFGTVLGIIRAFHDLSLEAQANTKAVMFGISEALVATAIGLFVAIPAVLAFNYFQKQVDRNLAITESLVQGILAGLPRAEPQPAARTAESGEGRRNAEGQGAR